MFKMYKVHSYYNKIYMYCAAVKILNMYKFEINELMISFWKFNLM